MYADIVDSLIEKALFLFTAYDSHQGVIRKEMHEINPPIYYNVSFSNKWF